MHGEGMDEQDYLPPSGFMVSVTNTGFWIGIVIGNQISPILANSALNISGTLFLFSGITFLFLLFVLFLLPETKVRTSNCSIFVIFTIA